MSIRVWRSVTAIVLTFPILGVVQAETPTSRLRTPYPDPLPEEILGGRIDSDADGHLFVSIEVHSDRVVLRDGGSARMATIPLPKRSSALLSPQGNYACVVTIDPEPTKEAGGACVKTVYDRRGVEVWSTTEQIEYDGPIPWPLLSDIDGSAIELTPRLQTLTFRDSRGSAVRTVRLVAEPEYDIELAATTARSEDGEYVAALANTNVPIPSGIARSDRNGNPIPARSGQAQVILLDRTGHELWRRPLEELGTGLKVGVSRSGAFVVAGCASLDEQRGIVGSGIYVFARDGSLIGKYAIHAPGGIWSPKFAVSHDEQRIALANQRRVMVLDSRTGNVVWDQTHSPASTAEGIQVIEDAKFLGQGYGLVIARTTHVKPEAYRRIDLIFIDESGRVVREAESCGTMHLRGDVTAASSPSGDRAGALTAQGLAVVER